MLFRSDEVLDQQAEKLAITRRIVGDIKEIWLLQPRFEKRSGKSPLRLIEQPRFRAAYDFLLLRAQAGEPGCAALADWWTKAQVGAGLPAPIDSDAGDDEGGEAAAPGEGAGSGAPKKRRRRGGRNRRKA